MLDVSHVFVAQLDPKLGQVGSGKAHLFGKPAFGAAGLAHRLLAAEGQLPSAVHVSGVESLVELAVPWGDGLRKADERGAGLASAGFEHGRDLRAARQAVFEIGARNAGRLNRRFRQLLTALINRLRDVGGDVERARLDDRADHVFGCLQGRAFATLLIFLRPQGLDHRIGKLPGNLAGRHATHDVALDVGRFHRGEPRNIFGRFGANQLLVDAIQPGRQRPGGFLRAIRLLQPTQRHLEECIDLLLAGFSRLHSG